MKTNLLSVTVGGWCLVLATTATAADRAWDGDGGDANWKTPANWDGDATYPAAGDALFFGGSTKLTNTNTLDAGTAVAGLTFNSGAGAFVLDGNALTLDGDVRNLSSNTQTVNLPLTLSGTRTVYGVNSAVKLAGALGGTGGLWVSVTNSSLTLSGANTYEGVTTVSNGQLTVTHSNALGSTNGNTVVFCRNSGCLQLSGGIDLAEPITLSGQRPSYGSSLLSASGSNTLSGPLTRHNEIRINANNGATLAVIGGVIPSGSGDMVINSSGTIAFYKTPVNLGANAFYTDSGGLTVIGVAGNTWGDTLVAGGTLRLDITNAVPESTVLKIGVDYSPNGTLNLNGISQTVSRLLSNTAKSGTRTITSPAPATLTLNQNASSVYNGLFAGAVSLVKNGTGTLTVTNATSTTTGDLIVNTGAVVIAQSASFNALANATVNGGLLELRTATGLADASTLRIANGAQVMINAGLMETVNRLLLDGVQQVSGTWGATGSGATHIDDAHFTGTGLLNVLSSPAVTPVAATWDAGGTDLLTDTTNNWVGDTLPAFDGTGYAIFGDAGTTATVSKAVSLYGLSFNRDGNFTVAAGDGTIALGAGGLLAKPLTTTSCSYTLAEDVIFTENQLWCITNNGAGTASVTVSGTLGDSNSVYALTKYGNGALVLAGSNSYDGVTTVKTGGVLRITNPYALGSTNGSTLVENGGWIEMSGGITVPETFTLYGDASTGYGGVLRSTGGSNTVSGLILNGSRIKCLSGSLDLTGGATGGQFVLGADGNTFIRIAEKPINIGGSTFFAHTGAPIILAVSNNVWGQLEVSGHYVRTDVDNALAPAGIITVGNNPTSGLDLNGTKQTIGRLQCTATPLAPTRIVFSATPATLTVDQNATSTYNGCIAGAVTLIKQNTGSLILANTNTAYGAFCVSNGSLIVSSTGTFGVNSTKVFVGGSGTLTLSNSVAIADAATVWMPSNGVNTAKINFADDVTEKVGWLFYGDKMQRAGTYGSSSSSAYHKDDTRFSGRGILQVLHDNSGTLIAVK